MPKLFSIRPVSPEELWSSENHRRSTLKAMRLKSVLYIQNGEIKLSVVNEVGKEAILAILGPGDFFGEGCLAGQSVRMGTATAITPTTLLVIEKNEMIRVLHAEHAFSDRFVSYMLSRNIRIEEDLVDQLFNSSEKRLARTLLLLARYGKENRPEKVIAKISQETLAEMIGTTRARVNFFMNKFKKLGFIRYNGGLHVNSSPLKCCPSRISTDLRVAECGVN